MSGKEEVLNSEKEVTESRLSSYGENHPELKEPNSYWGGWHDSQSGKYYLDVSKAFSSRSEAESFGRANKQQAIFRTPTGASGDEGELVNLTGRAARPVQKDASGKPRLRMTWLDPNDIPASVKALKSLPD